MNDKEYWKQKLPDLLSQLPNIVERLQNLTNILDACGINLEARKLLSQLLHNPDNTPGTLTLTFNALLKTGSKDLKLQGCLRETSGLLGNLMSIYRTKKKPHELQLQITQLRNLANQIHSSLKSLHKEVKIITTNYVYHSFISYRKQEPDKEFARKLLTDLEQDGYKVAIDDKDFAPNESFLTEMERCVRESRFTLCILSPRYLESGNCQEEAIICKVLDMAERRHRLIPLIIENVQMPVWLYNITGIRFDDPQPLVDPYKRLKETLDKPI